MLHSIERAYRGKHPAEAKPTMDHQLAPTADPPPAPSTTPPDSVNIGPARSGPLPSAPRAAAATPPPGLTEPASGPSIGHVVGQTVASLALLGVAAGVFLWLGKAPAPPLEPPERAIPAVSVVPATPRAEGLTFTVDGVVRPFRDLPVAAESSGRVTVKSPSCRVGRVVSAGEVLIQVDPRDYQLEVQRLQEELEQAEVSAA
ncbi:MAG: biotin/lipoyl-binding protein, partial [Planctomycetota bacterium]